MEKKRKEKKIILSEPTLNEIKLKAPYMFLQFHGLTHRATGAIAIALRLPPIT